jgi:hypothetical protein
MTSVEKSTVENYVALTENSNLNEKLSLFNKIKNKISTPLETNVATKPNNNKK